MLGSLILYLKGMRIIMFQLSGFYCRGSHIVTDCVDCTFIIGLRSLMLELH